LEEEDHLEEEAMELLQEAIALTDAMVQTLEEEAVPELEAILDLEATMILP
jgi:hypothetical protein